MKDLEIVAKIKICNYNELTDEQKRVVDEAKKATLRAYAPYSNYSVGAAALLDNGEIVSGSNQENAAYPSGICAERTTLFYAGSQYPEGKVRKMAIVARSNGEITEDICAPCGACRQVILESEHRAGAPIELMLCGREQIYIFNGIRQILPFAFDIDSLKNPTLSKNI